jgi:hypothetical protein
MVKHETMSKTSLTQQEKELREFSRKDIFGDYIKAPSDRQLVMPLNLITLTETEILEQFFVKNGHHLLHKL